MKERRVVAVAVEFAAELHVLVAVALVAGQCSVPGVDEVYSALAEK